ncbi:hypothetical protein PPL_07236 [Heterostelium album PN500]|uniref:Uncharacterized protein n=1 Tax=Heterostelium pallidum (strain ATCC 26659 / Pp 5 / PN500) TaxID=670386 RepID=D3BES1_HETP5|nr:hypothetical protein PPL_07236 [Heterostelium album PN500]EFA80402.1 hypothetical protein PPL_07236 [Heterostelium album PN500]|eukprot:XP_020432522.1 hypothetical protein PPL_07236 [Heterostelium album PN500]
MNNNNKVEIDKSPSDYREYRYVKLENGLSVLLIHDEQEQQSAASLSVGVGSFQNPKEYEGLAHFLEHMLFLGTEKYPVEKEFLTHIEQNGGSYNGVTHYYCTSYYFKINQQHLEQALDRFSSFFISPLFTKDATHREVNAVNSEYQSNVQNDLLHRFYATLMSFDDHPLTMFNCGSLETLNKADLHSKMVEFYHKYYSANLMNLVIIGPQSLDELEKLATSYFSSIKNNNVKGLENYDAIIGHIYNYIELMKKVDVSYLYDEKQQLQHSRWASIGKSDLMSYANAISTLFCINSIERGDILSFDYIFESFNTKQYQEILNCFNLDNAIINLYSKQYEKQAQLVHKYYCFQYSKVAITKEDIEKWKSVEPTPKLYIPIRNPYSPENFDIKSEQTNVVQPLDKLFDEQGITVLFSPDTQFNTPLANFYFKFNSSIATARQLTMVYLLKKCAKILLNEDVRYFALMNGTTLKWDITLTGVSYRISGFNDKIAPLILDIFSKLSTFDLSEFQFQLAVAKALKKKRNTAFCSPIDHGLNQIRPFLSNTIFGTAEDIHVLESVDYQEFLYFVRHYFKTMNIQSVITGNLSREEVLDFSNQLPKVMNERRPSPKCDILYPRRVELTQGKRYHLRQTFVDENQVNSVCIAFFQVGKGSVELYSMGMLYNQLIYSSFFSELRTKQQLGYIVQTASDTALATVHLRVQVQSDTKDPEYLFDRIDEYIQQGLKEELNALDESEIQKYVTSLQEKLLQKKPNSRFQALEYTQITQTFEGDQKIRQKQVDYLSTVKKCDVLDFFEQYVLNKEKRKMVVVQIYGRGHKINPINDPNAIELTDPAEFKSSIGLYPPFCLTK